MKKAVSLLLVVVLAMTAVFALASTAMAATPGTIKLSSGTLNVRKTASKTASIVTKLSNGDSVDIISKTSNSAGAWYKIEANGKTGYVLQQYVKVGSSSGGTTTTSKTGTVRTSTMKIYKSKSSKSTLLATAKKGDTVDILQLTSSSSWAKVKYNGKTGYCAKSSLTVGGSAGGSTTPGSIDPAFATLSAPEGALSTADQVRQAVNYYLSTFTTSFTLPIKFSSSSVSQSMVSKMLPGMADLNYGYTVLSRGNTKPITYTVASLTPKTVNIGGKSYSNVINVNATVNYNEAGKLLAYYKNGTPIVDSKVTTLKNKVESIFKSVIKSGMSDYEKELALHDYIVDNCGYDAAMSDASYTAYGVLVSGKGSCQGYAEATCLLFTLAGLESHFVRADSKVTGTGTHGFVKTKVNGSWYCVDTTANDPKPDRAGRIRHDFFNVSDEVMLQRYTPWCPSDYASCTKMDQNYFVKNDLVVSSTSELQAAVKAATAAKKSSLEVWTNNYSSGSFGLAKIKAALPSGVSVTSYSLGSSEGLTMCSIYMEFDY